MSVAKRFLFSPGGVSMCGQAQPSDQDLAVTAGIAKKSDLPMFEQSFNVY